MGDSKSYVVTATYVAWLSEESNVPHSESTTYELYSVINHYEDSRREGLTSGHCECSRLADLRRAESLPSRADTAMLRNSDDWYDVGDETVRRVSERRVRASTASAYLLFYRLLS